MGAGVLLTKFNQLDLLLLTAFLTFTSGVGMILTMPEVGYSNLFIACYCLTEIFDYVNNLVGGVMVYKYLELESRGTVLSLASVAISAMKAILTYMNGQLNNAYKVYQP